MDEREKNLPKWTQELLANLRWQITTAKEPFVNELAKIRPRCELLQRRNEALQELLECAAKGEHKTAQEIMDIIGQYDLILTKRE